MPLLVHPLPRQVVIPRAAKGRDVAFRGRVRRAPREWQGAQSRMSQSLRLCPSPIVLDALGNSTLARLCPSRCCRCRPSPTHRARIPLPLVSRPPRSPPWSSVLWLPRRRVPTPMPSQPQPVMAHKKRRSQVHFAPTPVALQPKVSLPTRAVSDRAVPSRHHSAQPFGLWML